MALLDDIAIFLEDAGLGAVNNGTNDGNIFTGLRPPSPDEVLVVHEYSGVGPIQTMREAKPVVIRPRLQIVSRAPTYRVARSNCQEAWDALVAVFDQTINTVLYERIEALSDAPFPLDRDPEERMIFACNWECWLTP